MGLLGFYKHFSDGTHKKMQESQVMLCHSQWFHKQILQMPNFITLSLIVFAVNEIHPKKHYLPKDF